MNRYLSFMMVFMFCSSCKSEFTKFKEEALAFAKNDNQIDEIEFQTLINWIVESDESEFQKFKKGKDGIDNEKLVSHLIIEFKKNKIALTDKDIWQPETKNSWAGGNVNVFLENSASMDGYVKGVTKFETAIYNLLGDFKISGVFDSLNLYYINKTIPYKKQNALSADIQDFIEKLEPSVFEQRGGDRSISDLKNILSTVLRSVDDNNSAVLISDFVFSPRKRANAQDFLNNQSVGIKIDFAEKLKSFDLACVFIRLESDFNGKYYDKNDSPLPYKGNRPYFVWIFGSLKQIKTIMNTRVLDNIKGGYSNRLVFNSTNGEPQTGFKILSTPKIGDFSRAQIDRKIITEASVSKDDRTKGMFEFSLAVDFSNSMQDLNYFLDSVNYRLSNPKYRLKVRAIDDKNDATLAGYTHILKLQTTDLMEEELKIEVTCRTPNWVINASSDDDSNILINDEEQSKTFGLRYLIEGAMDAFCPKYNSSAINTISIKIKK